VAPTEREPDLDELSSAIDRLLRLHASRKVHARRAEAAEVPVSPPGRVLLRRLVEGGPTSLGALAEQTHMDPAATGRQVRQLEAAGLVARRVGDHDARVTVVEASEDGRGAHERFRAVGDQHLADALAAWSADDRRQLATLLSRFVDDLRTVQYRHP